VAVDLLDALHDRPPRVLALLRGDEGVFVGTLDADEDREEADLLHEAQQLVVVGEVHGGLGRELERPVSLLEPRLEVGEELLRELLVADEVVVYEIDVTSIAEVVERLQLLQHLLRRLRPRHAAVELDDVAEFALKGAAAAPLHRHVEIVFELEEVEARAGRLRDIGSVGIDVDLLRGAGREVFQEPGQREFGLAQHEVIGFVIEVGAARGVGSPDDDPLAPPLRLPDEMKRVPLLRDHSADEHDVGPREEFGAPRLDVAVHEPHLPVLWQQGGHRDEPERRSRVACPGEAARLPVVPEGRHAETGMDEKTAHGVARIPDRPRSCP
jgi:hypothetical protein